RRLLHRWLGFTRNPEIVRRGILIGTAPAREQFPHELVIRLVICDRFADPVAELPRSLVAQVFPIHLQQITPFERPVIDKRRPRRSPRPSPVHPHSHPPYRECYSQSRLLS